MYLGNAQNCVCNRTKEDLSIISQYICSMNVEDVTTYFIFSANFSKNFKHPVFNTGEFSKSFVKVTKEQAKKIFNLPLSPSTILVVCVFLFKTEIFQVERGSRIKLTYS